MNIIARVLAWWNRADVLSAEVDKLRRERQVAVDALKKIATRKEGLELITEGAGYYVPRLPKDIAHDCLTKELGLIPFRTDMNCPVDRIYLIPHELAGTPTDYL